MLVDEWSQQAQQQQQPHREQQQQRLGQPPSCSAGTCLRGGGRLTRAGERGLQRSSMQRRLPVQVCCPATRPALPTATWRSAPRHEPASRSAASPPRPGAPGRRRRPQPRAPPPPPPSCAPAVPRCGVQGQGGRQQGSDVTLTLEELHPPLATFLRCWQAEGCATGGQAVHPRSLSKHRQQAPPDADSCTHPAASQHPRANTNQSDNAQDAQPPTLTPALPRAAPSAAAQHPAEPPAALRDERLPPVAPLPARSGASAATTARRGPR